MVEENKKLAMQKKEKEARLRSIKESTGEYTRMLRRLASEQKSLRQRLEDYRHQNIQDDVDDSAAKARLDFLALQAKRLRHDIQEVEYSMVEIRAAVQRASSALAARLDSICSKASAPMDALRALRVLHDEVDNLASTAGGEDTQMRPG